MFNALRPSFIILSIVNHVNKRFGYFEIGKQLIPCYLISHSGGSGGDLHFKRFAALFSIATVNNDVLDVAEAASDGSNAVGNYDAVYAGGILEGIR